MPLFPVLLPLAGVGLAIGFMAGMFGVGGGFMLTPVLNIFFGVPMEVAVGSTLCQQCGSTVGSFLKYRRLKLGEPRIALVMIGGALAGVIAGADLLDYLKGLGEWHFGRVHPPVATVVLEGLYALLLSMTIALTFAEALEALRRTVPRGDKTIPGPLAKVRFPPYIDLPRVDLYGVSVPGLCVVGFAVGLLGGLMGIGGGVAFMPILIYGYGLSIRRTAGSSLLLLFAVVVMGTLRHAWHGNVNLALAMAIAMGSSVGALLGAMTTHRLTNRKLRWWFLGLLAATVAMILVDLVRNLR